MSRTLRAALASVAVALLPAAAAQAAVTVWRCVNPHSGAAWDIRIDEEKKLVDSLPAEITAARVEWHDTVDGGYYSLDRATGALTMRAASSTGGYFLYHRCAPR
jgi:opacity protein-like surface antigen